MPRARDPNRDKAHEMYEQHSGNITNREIANNLGVDEKVIAVWKQRDNWLKKNNVVQRSKSKVVQQKNKNNKKNAEKYIDDGIKETMENENLTPEQRLFCIYYSKSFNATQSYQKAYQCSYENACGHAHELWKKVEVKKEVQRLNQLKAEQIAINEADMVEFHMRIAFADIGNYVTFGREEVPVMSMLGPVKDEKGKNLTKVINAVRLNESDYVDTQIIQEIKQGKEGVSIKLVDRCKSMDWLDRFFLFNPMDRHKMEYDKRKLELDLIKIDYDTKKNEPQSTLTGSDNFMEALNAKAAEVWKDEE